MYLIIIISCDNDTFGISRQTIGQIIEGRTSNPMYVTEEQFNALLEAVNEMKSKLDLYEKCENSREKEFRELERDVYKLKTGNAAPVPDMFDAYERTSQAAEIPQNDSAGTVWLR
jgi:hypothetical protein